MHITQGRTWVQFLTVKQKSFDFVFYLKRMDFRWQIHKYCSLLKGKSQQCD